MQKSAREIKRVAQDLGLENVSVRSGTPHGRILGTVGGKQVCLVVSMTKAFATTRTQSCLKTNIKRAMREARP